MPEAAPDENVKTWVAKGPNRAAWVYRVSL